MKNEVLKLKDEDGNIKEYKILLVFIYNNRNYIVYTDDEINVYAKRFDPNDLSMFENLETEDEWNEVERLLLEIEGEN